MPNALTALLGMLMLSAWGRLPLLQVAWPGQGRTYAELVTQGQTAYARGDYQAASQLYEQAAQIDAARRGQPDRALGLNLAHSHYRAGEYLKAAQGYTELTHTEDPSLASMAHNQLAAIALKLGNHDQALEELKTALRLDPDNQTARLNYEKVLFGKRPDTPPDKKPQPQQGQKPRPQQGQNPQQNPGQQGQQNQPTHQNQGQGQQSEQKPSGQQPPQQPPQGGKEGGPGQQNQSPPGQMRRPNDPEGQDQQPGDMRRRRGQTGGQVLENPNPNDQSDDPNSPADPRIDPDGRPATRAQAQQLRLPPEQARQILEAMKSSETQYLQQRRLRSRRPPSPGQPDW